MPPLTFFVFVFSPCDPILQNTFSHTTPFWHLFDFFLFVYNIYVGCLLNSVEAPCYPWRCRWGMLALAISNTL